MRGKGKLLAVALAGALALSGCGAEPEPTPEPTATLPPVETAEGLDFVLPCYPNGGFHPMTGTSQMNAVLEPLLYRGLFAVDRQFQAQGDLCEGYTVSGDGLTWTFRLADAVFSDGSPLTAAEAVESLNQARQSARYAGRLADISRVEAVGEGEVVVTLSRANGALPVLLDVPIVKETEDPLRPLGTGPYYLEGEGDSLALTAKPGAEVPLGTIALRSVHADDDLVYAFDAQEISLVNTDLTGTNVLGYSGRFETVDYPTTGFLYLGCNVRSGACQEQAVRQAIARAFDREEIAGTLLAGHAVASALPVHPNAEVYDGALARQLDCDPEGAQAILEGGGWTLNEEGRLRRGRSSLSLKIVVNQDNIYKVTVVESLADALEELGCAVTVEKLPWDDFVTALERREFDLFLGETVLTADFDLEKLLGTGGDLNYGGYSSAETDALLTAYRAAGGQEREKAAGALYSQVTETAPVISLCFKNGSVLTQWGQVKGAEPTQRDVFAGLESWIVADSE